MVQDNMQHSSIKIYQSIRTFSTAYKHLIGRLGLIESDSNGHPRKVVPFLFFPFNIRLSFSTLFLRKKAYPKIYHFYKQFLCQISFIYAGNQYALYDHYIVQGFLHRIYFWQSQSRQLSSFIGIRLSISIKADQKYVLLFDSNTDSTQLKSTFQENRARVSFQYHYRPNQSCFQTNSPT